MNRTPHGNLVFTPDDRQIRDWLNRPDPDGDDSAKSEYVWRAAAAIRDGWTDRELASRAGGAPEPYTIPFARPVDGYSVGRTYLFRSQWDDLEGVE